MQQVEWLILTIGVVRRKLEELSANKGYTHPEVVSLSQELDELLNQYRKAVA